jgi:PII-like signaling protein
MTKRKTVDAAPIAGTDKATNAGSEIGAGMAPDGESPLVWATMVRVYLAESDHELKPLLKCLHDELKVCGVTVMRGVAGFGASGVVHSARLVDLSTDLPLVLEFFDRPDRARAAIDRIKEFVEPGHVVSWSVNVEPKP